MKIKETYRNYLYDCVNVIMFRLKIKKNGSNYFVNEFTGKFVTVDVAMRAIMEGFAYSHDKNEFNTCKNNFYLIVEMLPDYFEDDFFTDDESDLIHNLYDMVFGFWDSSYQSGANELLAILKERNIIQSKVGEQQFVKLMREIAPWQFGIHNWKPYNEEALKDSK